MNIKPDINYTIISNYIDKELLDKFQDYTIINDNTTYEALENMIYNYPSKTICFNDCLRKYKKDEKKKIFELLKIRGVNFINITSDIEEVLAGDYLVVFYNHDIAIEGNTLEVLKEEKILKRLGFALPFTYDLSLQLKLYNVLTDTETDLEKLVMTLWN